MKNVKCNPLVLRQTLTSPFSCFLGTWEELEQIVEEHWQLIRAGYKDGVVLVGVPPTRFLSGIVALREDSEISASFRARRENEDAFVEVRATGEKAPARNVDIVVYRHDELGTDASSGADWEIVSINARTTDEPEPMTPMAMARNFLELPGGTKAEYTPAQFAESIVFWSRHAMFGGSQ